MKCVINLYGENSYRESVCDIESILIDKLDYIALKKQMSVEDLVINLLEEFTDGVLDG